VCVCVCVCVCAAAHRGMWSLASVLTLVSPRARACLPLTREACLFPVRAHAHAHFERGQTRMPVSHMNAQACLCVHVWVSACRVSEDRLAEVVRQNPLLIMQPTATVCCPPQALPLCVAKTVSTSNKHVLRMPPIYPQPP